LKFTNDLYKSAGTLEAERFEYAAIFPFSPQLPPLFTLELFMISTLRPIPDQLMSLYFQIKREFYQWRYPNLTLEPGVRIKHKLVIGGDVKVTIGANSRLGKRVCIYGKGQVTIGQNVLLNGADIGCHDSVTIGDHCLISDCFIADTDYHNLQPHLRHVPPGPKVTAPIVIHRNVWIGARATVLKGVTIGENSVVGLGSIVRQSVPENVVVIGNPAQIVKELAVQELQVQELQVQELQVQELRDSVYSG
jgi:acetyltransferase-like isoleucine patch superfamily enzyme